MGQTERIETLRNDRGAEPASANVTRWRWLLLWGALGRAFCCGDRRLVEPSECGLACAQVPTEIPPNEGFAVQYTWADLGDSNRVPATDQLLSRILRILSVAVARVV